MRQSIRFARVLAWLWCAAALVGAVRGSAAAGASPGPMYCNFIFADTDRDIVGLQRFVDGAKRRGLYGRMKLTLLLHSDKARFDDPAQKAFFQQLYADGNEIGVWFAWMRPAVAKWLGIPEPRITTAGFQLFDDPNVEEQAADTLQGFRASANACIEGDTFREEMWDVPHNWSGAPLLPYWVQWDEKRPTSTARVNRELHKKRAVLELQWATRTAWESYDRICLPWCFHFGEPLKRLQWQLQLVKRGDISYWQDELGEYERNLRAGRLPFAYCNTASETNVFSPGGPWAPMLDTDEALDCALDLAEWMLGRGWKLTTVREFVDFYQAHWPCPSAPSAALLQRDVVAGRTLRNGARLRSGGELLRAETAHFGVTDHDNRMAPETLVAYDLETPNLLRGGYTFGKPELFGAACRNKAQYAATTGNALFRSPSSVLEDSNGTPLYHRNGPVEARDRTFTLYLGEDWRPYQFAPSRFASVRRQGETLTWTKEMRRPVGGSDIRLRYHTRLAGSEYRVTVDVLGRDAVGRRVRLRLCPYFHQGWDADYAVAHSLNDPRIPDPARAGQERNVFAAVGERTFSYSESNDQPRSETIPLTGTAGEVEIFNRNPGNGATIDDNPDMNRGFTLMVAGARSVTLLDPPGPSKYVTAEADFGLHKRGRRYTFAFRFWHGQRPQPGRSAHRPTAGSGARRPDGLAIGRTTPSP